VDKIDAKFKVGFDYSEVPGDCALVRRLTLGC
jgi:hypothetical protein